MASTRCARVPAEGGRVVARGALRVTRGCPPKAGGSSGGRSVRHTPTAVGGDPRCTRSRTAPPSREPPLSRRFSSSPATTSAAPVSRASRVKRTATAEDSGGAESMMTRANAPHRSRTSAHHAARAASRGRTIHNPSPSLKCAQSRGASVRVASMYATQPDRPSVSSTSRRSSVAIPLPRAPTTSVSRPRGSPPPPSTASSSWSPVGSAEAIVAAGETREAEGGRRSTRD